MDPLVVLAYGAEQTLPLIGIGIGKFSPVHCLRIF